ncbi:hypothetical protein ABPG75_011587 [Micractinium tetrahymenae]
MQNGSLKEAGDGYRPPFDADEFRRLGHAMVDFIAEYQQSLGTGSLPVRSQASPGYLAPRLPGAAPEQPEGLPAILEDVQRHILPGMTHWQSPSFFAWFPANTSPPSLVADMLCSALGVIGFSWVSSPAATELEAIVLDWLGQLLRLPPSFLSPQGGTGVIQSTASEATLVALLSAKARAMEGRPEEDALKLCAYCSDQAHSSVRKACMVAGITRLRALPTSPEHLHALQPEAIEAAVQADLAEGLLPCFACATIGTTNSCAVDPLPAIGQLALRHSLWLHVDAAYAGTFGLLPELSSHFEGLELADSFDTNPHKGLLTNFDCSTMWFREGRARWARQALSLTPEYLRHHANDLDYKDLQVPLGRKFRALKLWFVMRMYGAEGLRAYLRNRLECQRVFEELLAADSRFLVAEGTAPRFGLVCFRLAGATRQQSEVVLEAVNASGTAFLVGTLMDGQHTIRMAIGSATVLPRHIREAWAAIQAAADEVLGPVATSNGAENGLAH